MSDSIMMYNGKRFFLDSILNYKGFKKRLTLLRKVHPKMKYRFEMKGTGKNTRFYLYVRRWGV